MADARAGSKLSTVSTALPDSRRGSKQLSLGQPNDFAVATVPSKPEQEVPEDVLKLDYFKAMRFYQLADKTGAGDLDVDAFGKLVSMVNPQTQKMSKAKLLSLFHDVDLDHSGGIDCFEFLSWAFGTESNWTGSVRKNLSDLDPQAVMQFYRMLPKGRKSINSDELFDFLSKNSKANITKETSNQIFQHIDADNSGGIDIREFLNWVNAPEDGLKFEEIKAERMKRRQARQAEMGRAIPRAQSVPTGAHRGDKTQPSIGACAPLEIDGARQADLFETAPNQPVKLEFTCGSHCDQLILHIQKSLKKSFGDEVEMKILPDNGCKGCRKLRVLCGRGIVLWDRYTMMSTQDDPFATNETARAWILKVLKQSMPNLMGTVNLRKVEEARRLKMQMQASNGQDGFAAVSMKRRSSEATLPPLTPPRAQGVTGRRFSK
jgi:Ca2+-binding EF-hand superfamily protein